MQNPIDKREPAHTQHPEDGDSATDKRDDEPAVTGFSFFPGAGLADLNLSFSELDILERDDDVVGDALDSEVAQEPERDSRTPA